MSHFEDRKSPEDRRDTEECVDCGKTAVVKDRERFSYWLRYGFEKGHSGDTDHLWTEHDDDWRCRECAGKFHVVEDDGS